MNKENIGKEFTNKAENIILSITDDNFSAYLTFADSPGIIDENEILALLNIAKIKHGFSNAIKYNRLHSIKKDLSIPFLIARGTDPNATPEIKLIFDKKNCFNPHESYNVMEMVHFEKVSKGQPLAELSVGSTIGTGKDVLGNDLTLISNIEPNVVDHFGPDIELDAETNTMIALNSGYPYVDTAGKIQIKSDFYINEDIMDISLELNGNLVINGQIKNTHLIVDGNLTVYGSIRDCMQHGLCATGNIDLDYAENSRIFCNGQIRFHDSVKNCILSAFEGIVGEENSSVSGGMLQSSNSISLFNVGNELPALTEIEISLATYTKELLKMIQAQSSTENDLAAEDLDNSSNLNRQNIMEEKYLAEIDQILNSPEKKHKISISNSLYPETRVRILNHSHVVTEEQGKTVFTLIDNDMVVNEVDRFV